MDSSVDLLPFKDDSGSQQVDNRLARICRSKELFRDRYRVLRALGRGGFGVTYLCRDMILPGNPLCVIKLLCPKVNNPVVLKKAGERFEREAKALSQLGSHASIPRLLDYFQVDEEFYLVQEYVRGHNLAKEVKVHGPQSEATVRNFLAEILPILDYVHKHNVIHRDIKPPNIIRCRDHNRLVLIDFGAVKDQISTLDDTESQGMTTQFVGTVGFAPPEQLALRPTFSSDIYSIGVTCLYLLTGRPPLEFEYDLGTGEIDWRADASVSQYFGTVLTKMLRVSPHERYQSVAEVQRALDLESHMDELAGCMNTQSTAKDEDGSDGEQDSYCSPIAQQAQAIRKWRGRLAKRRSKERRHQNHALVNSAYFH
ncbi:MAG: serine/threonine-protein kinase [Cyanobacteria bacterium P01_F01_bin.150]